MRCRHYARCSRQRRPAKDLILGVFDGSGVQPHAHVDRRIVPAMGVKRSLCVDRSEYGRGRIGERDAKRVPDDAKCVSLVLGDCAAEQRVVTLGRCAHRRRSSIPKRCAALDVGEQERERMRRRGSDHGEATVGRLPRCGLIIEEGGSNAARPLDPPTIFWSQAFVGHWGQIRRTTPQ